jgi:ribosome biogenesis protein BRX1
MADSPKPVLIVCSRGVSQQQRHLIKDLTSLIPHSKTAPKVDLSKNPNLLNDLASSLSCQSVFYLEARRKQSVVWLAQYPSGPSLKLILQNLRTSEEMRLPGNCSKHSSPILTFDDSFKNSTSLTLMQYLLIKTFANSSKQAMFLDHVLAFSHVEGKVFFRNYEIAGKEPISITEIGPRFVMTPIKIRIGFMTGEVAFKSGKYVLPAKIPTKKPSVGDYEKRKRKSFRKEFVANSDEESDNEYDDV